MLLSLDPLAKSITTTNPTKITWDKNLTLIYNRKKEKKYKIVYTKRRVDWSTFQAYPYGYKCFIFFLLSNTISSGCQTL